MDLFMMKKFNKDRYLKKLRFKKYKRYLYIGIPCILVLLIGIYFAYSKFSVFKEEEVVRTTVGDFISGDVVVGAYIDGEYSKTIPGKNDGYIVDKIICDNDATASWNNDSWGIIVTNLTKRTKCNVYFETKKTFAGIIEAASSDTSMFASDDADKNVRYIGANPNNYVYFNCSDYNNQSDSTCEKWRIIGVFNNVTKSDGTKENLVKIIRDESIGDIAWDSNDVNDWSTATLQQNLNSGTYYTTTLKNVATRNAIESVVWNLGGTSAYNILTASTFYTAERGTTVYSGRPTTWTGRIGLMYPSDYGYATAGGSTTNRTTCLSTALRNWGGSEVADCKNNDYLFNGSYQWTLMPSSGGVFRVLYVYSSGLVANFVVSNSRGVRPALFLKSNISIKAGTGESSSPYQLKLGID